MGLDKRQRAEKKAAKERDVREYRRKEKEWLRNQGGGTWRHLVENPDWRLRPEGKGPSRYDPSNIE